jgi:hypothetical protein
VAGDAITPVSHIGDFEFNLFAASHASHIMRISLSSGDGLRIVCGA